MSRVHQLRLSLLSLIFCLILGAASYASTKKPPLKPVNINTAGSEELQQVPGIGPATAEKILQMRKSYGPFKSVDDLLAIKGLGRKRLEKMRRYLTVGKSAGLNKLATQPKPATAAKPPAKSTSSESSDPTEESPPH